MIRFILYRLIGAIVVLFVVSLVTFLIFQIAPTLSHTNPVYYYIGKVPFKPGSPQLLALEHRFGFDLPVPEQYWHYISGIMFGQTITDGVSTPIHCPAPCFGYSFKQNDLVGSMLLQAAPVSISLLVGAAVLWLVGGVTVGTFSALKPGSIVDRVGMTGSLAAVSLPIFFTGPLLLLVFEYTLGWLPNVAYAPITQDPLQWFKSMILPWVALAFLFAALYARLTRSNMMETMGEDYIRTARAKGLPRRTVVIKHGLRAALTPIVTIFGIDVGTLVGTTVITETVFNLRGLGYLSISAIQTLDLPVIEGVTIVAALALVIANFLVDILYAVIDPRVTV
ncbi:ABC transporter permease [Frondihabitans sp. PAMC 28766]|uniref:ABC transporter permease n=1 Tax=Frondihabitans sp. PAMC 28766 TaxID=1795630 RepID=UPI00078BE6EC|nr:ABC transporter permease [Frondihabitans sp. PAMC 28766]AMM20285.1 ABC transporter permease [Frondihabitans sp. PAMC 28766]